MSGVSLDTAIARQTAVFIDRFQEWGYYRGEGSIHQFKGIGHFEMIDGAAAWPQEAVYRSDSPVLSQLCVSVSVQFEGQEGIGCMTSVNLIEVELGEFRYLGLQLL